VRRKLAGCRDPNAEPVRKLEPRPGREPDQRRDRGVLAMLAEQRLLEARIGALEGVVAPIGPPGRLGDVGEERQQDRAQQRLLLAALGGMRGRVYAGGRLAGQLLDRDPRVRERAEPVRPCLDVGAQQGPVLVEPTRMLLEGERDLVAGLDVRGQEGERSQAEAAQAFVQVRGAHGHDLWLRAGSLLSSLGEVFSLASRAPVGHAVVVALAV
jgi:hypothetical protein